MNRIRYTMFVVTVLFVLVLSAMSTVPALADDDAPPLPESTTTEETPPAEEVVIEETPLVSDGTAPADEAAPSEETFSELIETLPEGTEVVVTDEAGEPVPLVTQAAADAVAFIDPVWCPIGVAPKTDGSGGCTISYGNLKLLIDNLMAGTAGVV